VTGHKCFQQLVAVVPGSERIERYQQQILAALTTAEADAFRAAAEVEAAGTYFIAQAYHCAVGTKPRVKSELHRLVARRAVVPSPIHAVFKAAEHREPMQDRPLPSVIHIDVREPST
jgi:hypothetical protein